MDTSALWVESYQGEVVGEALFGLLAEQQQDGERRHQLKVLTLLERATKELAEPVFERRGLDRGDTAQSLAAAAELAAALVGTSWEDLLGSFVPVITQYLATYRTLAETVPEGAEREIAEAYVAHELALAAFVRRALGQEAGDPLAPVLALPHVAATTH